MTQIYYKERERLVRDVMRIGRTITARADEIVGDMTDKKEVIITAQIAVDTLPIISWKETINCVLEYERKEKKIEHWRKLDFTECEVLEE